MLQISYISATRFCGFDWTQFHYGKAWEKSNRNATAANQSYSHAPGLPIATERVVWTGTDDSAHEDRVLGFLLLHSIHRLEAALPLLTTARQAHDLVISEAARGYPVFLHAVVTYYDPYIDPRRPALFVSDNTGGVFVRVVTIPKVLFVPRFASGN